MDFYQISVKERKDGTMLLYPDWTVGRSKDLMVQGRAFYAIWDEARQLWSRDEYDVQRLVDEDLHAYAKAAEEKGIHYQVMNLRSFNTNIWSSFRKFLSNVSDSSHSLDDNLTFENTVVKKSDYVSRKLPYALEEGTTEAWDELLDVLYSPEERAKIEWAIGSVVAGDSKWIQKFLVFYGPAGSGKSTILNVIHKMFAGYVATFDAKALGSNNNAFATEVFKANPLVAIQHDGDLSKIEDNTKLNSIISHEDMSINEKFKPSYTSRVNAFLFMGTNQPVKIADAKSGLVRRLIDVHPSGKKLEPKRYQLLMQQIDFELGPIAHKCLHIYKAMGKNYYDGYRPVEMMLQTDMFYNFIEAYYDVFKAQDGTTLKQAYQMFKEYCADSSIERVIPQYKFRDELRNYFHKFQDKAVVNGENVRSYYSDFKRMTEDAEVDTGRSGMIELDGEVSIFDIHCAGYSAQYAKSSGEPKDYWDNVTEFLSELDTSKLHFVRIPDSHIVIDFDLVDEDGNKDLELNLAEASKWPATYTELSKSGKGVHLHYIYTGDVTELASVYDVGIEVKTLLGKQSLRRRLTKCNSLEIASISGGLPKKEKRMIENQTIKSEKSLRDLIERNLRKEIHPGTKPSVDFIKTILDEQYENGLSYDLRDMRGRILTFAARSTNQATACIKMVQKMQFVGKNDMPSVTPDENKPLVFYDVEVYQNLFVICWKYAGDSDVVRMVNPTAQEVEALFGMKLVGFHNRGYDNHILYARFLGYGLEDLYKLSQKIISNNRAALFGEAYHLSYADIYDFTSKKQGLKKYQIELGIHHVEMDIPWDEPVPEDLWPRVVDYCANDVVSTEKVFEARKQDFVARQILAELSGLTVNHTTANHTAKIIFGEEKNPQKAFKYTDLSEMFPGYEFTGKESTYREEVTGEGGYVYAEPGVYENVALLDVASMHPTSIELLELFGPYTKNYSELKAARLAIKHKEYEKAGSLLGGRIKPYLGDPADAEALSYALKIVINIVYGLTSARFDNPFRDVRNVDNIVAKRGALFMIDLMHAVQEQGFTVAHIKTDSIKIPDATPEIIQFVFDFGKKYGYDFEHECTYDKLALVNEAVYIARFGDEWTAVGAQFQHPYVYKTLFTKEPIVFDDFCETKNVTAGAMYLDFNDNPLRMVEEMVHVGRTGSFVPVLESGGTLWRVKDGKRYAVTGTKGYRWIEREVAKHREETDELFVDMSYFESLADEAYKAIEYYGPVERFVA